jgi:RNA polymerase sigma-70 factor, ECF subfamily
VDIRIGPAVGHDAGAVNGLRLSRMPSWRRRAAERAGRSATPGEPGAHPARTEGVAELRRADTSSVRSNETTDEAFIRALYDQHARPLLSYALRLTGGDRQRAEDVVQETFLRAWRHPIERTPESVRPWLFTVARNIAVDAFRARRARPPEAGPDGLDIVAVDDEVDRALEAWQLADAMSSLSADHRQVLVETYYRGRSVAEAAAVLGVPPGTVKSRTYYALRALKLVLEERGVTEA